MSALTCPCCKQYKLRHHTHSCCGYCWRKLSPHTQADLIRSEKAWRAGKLGGAIFQSVRSAAYKEIRAVAA